MAKDEELIRAARGWALDCGWRDEPEEIEEMPDNEIWRGVAWYYDGGIPQFIRDARLDD